MQTPGILFVSKENKIPFYYYNREISWLKFNERVLQEANNHEVPLLERIKFLAIFSSNLDEFFQVRVAAIQRFVDEYGKVDRAQLMFNPKHTLKEIQEFTLELQTKFEFIFNHKIAKELAKNNIYLLNENDIPSNNFLEIRNLFRNKILPYLNPIIITSRQKFPELTSRRIYLAIKLSFKNDKSNVKYALIEIPTHVIDRFWRISINNINTNIMFVDDIIRYNLKYLFESFDFDDYEAYTIKITRDAELDLDHDLSENFIEKVNKGIKNRKKGNPVRFIYDKDMPEDLLHLLKRRMKLNHSSNIPGGRYHNLSDLMQFPELITQKKSLKYPEIEQIPIHFLEKHKRVFEAISEKDVMLHHPYQSFDYVLRFLREASIDPDVISIKTTLYRIAKISMVANNLITAVLNGKKVTVMIEIKARFDEETNIFWGQKLEEAGAKVIYSFNDKKVHAKMCLVSRIEKGEIAKYAHLSTGNYNGVSAKLYCDDSILTKNKKITTDVEKLFNSIQTQILIQKPLKTIFTAPNSMRNQFYNLIDGEIKKAKKNENSCIILKMNSLTDVEMIKKLYEASNAGVRISLIIRGICCLVPGIKNMSENIQIISIIDRWLEHSRVYIFGAKGQEKIYLSSADFMNRNLSNRFETAFPVLDKNLKEEILHIINLQLSDNVQARIIDRKQMNNYVIRPENAIKHRAQSEIYTYLESL